MTDPAPSREAEQEPFVITPDEVEAVYDLSGGAEATLRSALARASQPAPADPTPRYRCFKCGRNEYGCECEGGGDMEPAPAGVRAPEPNWRADRTGHCPCGGQCHHGDRIKPCSESCAEAMQRQPAPAGVRAPEPRCVTCGLPDRGHDDSHGFHPAPVPAEGLDVERLAIHVGAAVEACYERGADGLDAGRYVIEQLARDGYGFRALTPDTHPEP